MSGDIEQIKSNSLTRDWYIKKGRDENNGFFLIIGGMYIGYRWISVLHAVLTAWHMPVLLLAVYYGREDFVVVSETIHFIILLLLAFLISMTYLSFRETLDRVFEAMGNGYYDYDGTLDTKTEKMIQQLQFESDRRKTILKYMFIGGCIGAMICVSGIRPILQYYLQKYIKIKKLPDGVNGVKNTFIYYPWDPANLWLNLIGYTLQDVYTIITANVIFGFVLIFVSTAESLSVQMEKLKLSLKRVKIRAAYVISKKPKDSDLSTDRDFSKALHICLRHSIKHHQVVIRIFDDFKSINHTALLWLVGGLTFLLCMSSVLFTADDVSLISKATFVFFISSELLATFLMCWYGEHLGGMSYGLPGDLYDTEWYEFSGDLLIYHRMLAMRSSKPCQLTAGGFSKIDRNTFLEVLKTAFSYANLLQASKQN
uniref:Odorant receptor n=1 Tax=Adelphocoris lineolatus TaxID=236346 RepID=A0A2I4PH48_ADELI|nr:olfactory receptor 15 [Adelphocoris lineolatus]